ncbi:MAG: MerR family transcriptional regulator [Bacteroidota bacterium]
MLIKELEEKSGLSRDTIRYYEKIGLLEIKSSDRKENNYKSYTEAHLHRLLLIQEAKKMGVTLKQIGDYIKAWEEDSLTYDEKKWIFNSQLDHLNKRIETLQNLKAYVQRKLEKLEEGAPMKIETKVK